MVCRLWPKCCVEGWWRPAVRVGRGTKTIMETVWIDLDRSDHSAQLSDGIKDAAASEAGTVETGRMWT